MRQLTKSALACLYKYSGAMHAQEIVARLTRPPFLTILIFHRVTDEIPPDGLTVSTVWFRRMCRLLQRNFRVVPLAEIFRLVRTKEPFPRHTVALTFDDCYRDNLFAARVLYEHGLPACFFIPTAFVGTDHVFDWDRDLRRMANLTWDDIREMASLGHEIGSHTETHADMAQVSIDQARNELVGSKKKLEQKLDQPVRWFAYPFGGREHFRIDRLPLLDEAGYEGTVSAYGGFIYPGVDYPILPREAPPYFRSLDHFELHLRGCLNWLYALRGQNLAPPRTQLQSPDCKPS